MKKAIIILSLIFGFTFIVMAQGPHPPHDPKISQAERQELEKMRKEMNLTDAQKAKMKVIHQSRKASKQARKAKMKEERMAEHKAMKAQMDAILTPEQKAKRDAIQAKRKEFKNS